METLPFTHKLNITSLQLSLHIDKIILNATYSLIEPHKSCLNKYIGLAVGLVFLLALKVLHKTLHTKVSQ